VYLLQQRKPDAPPEWIQRLPQISKRLEDSLYRTAASFEEYIDENTLKQRLQKLATDMGKKAASLSQQPGQSRPSSAGVPLQPNQQALPHQPLHQPLPVQPQLQQGLQQQLKAQPVTTTNILNQPLKTPNLIVNMTDMNPNLPQVIQQPAPSFNPTGPIPSSSTSATTAPNALPISSNGIHNPMVTLMNNPVGAVANTGTSSEGANPTTGAPKTTSDRQQVLRHQQQRLLLLRHAAKCPHEDGRCPVTIHCAGMKRLWKHIAECKDQKCLVPHCVSSRYVLSHYHRCRDLRCPVCGPVREAIQRSHEKQKQMQQLKQRHEQEMQNNKSEVHVGDTVTQSAVVSPFQLAPEAKRARFDQTTGTAQMIVNPKSINSNFPHINAFPQPSTLQNIATDYAAPLPVPSTSVSMAPGGDLSVLPMKVESTNPRPQEDHSLINSFTVEEIEIHIKSLYRGLQLAPEALKTRCLDVMKQLMNHQHYWVFSKPVDPVDLGLDDYFQIVKNPMDLGTIQKRLENGYYHQLKDFEDDVNLTFDNAMLYNPAGTVVHNMAVELKQKFSKEYEKLIALMKAEDERRKNSDACALCGCEKLLFEPPVFYCNGLNCPSKRIRRNSYYYVGGNNQYHWCHLCFNDLKDSQDLPMGDIVLKKNQLLKKKNDEVHEESWVQCDRCERWIHQICGLFNTRQNKDQKSEYVCPACTIEDRKRRGFVDGTSKTPGAEDLQRTKLSQYLESHVRMKVDDFFEREAVERAAIEVSSTVLLSHIKSCVEQNQYISFHRIYLWKKPDKAWEWEGQ
jgi:E1A/CREB-binding protein